MYTMVNASFMTSYVYAMVISASLFYTYHHVTLIH